MESHISIERILIWIPLILCKLSLLLLCGSVRAAAQENHLPQRMIHHPVETFHPHRLNQRRVCAI